MCPRQDAFVEQSSDSSPLKLGGNKKEIDMALIGYLDESADQLFVPGDENGTRVETVCPGD